MCDCQWVSERDCKYRCVCLSVLMCVLVCAAACLVVWVGATVLLCVYCASHFVSMHVSLCVHVGLGEDVCVV